MRLVLSAAALALAASSMFAAAPASAQESRIYPWCFETGRGSKNCGFVTLEQCRATMSGDNSGSCIPNPFYQAREPRR